jgi:hypothetical protein
MTLPIEQALELLATPEVRRALDPQADLRAAAADALAADHSEAGLIALLRATVDEPLVAGAAIRALGRRTDAALQIRTHLHQLLAELRVSDDRLGRRKLMAVLGIDGRNGLLALVAPTVPDAELIELWQTHPIVAVKHFAARELVRRSVDHAYSILTSGLPGANEPYRTGTLGGLDNGPLRNLLAYTICEVLLRDPAAHERLSHYVGAQSSWFEQERAALINTLQGYQRGEFDESTWLSGYRKRLAPAE